MTQLNSGETTDTFYTSRLKLTQLRYGYRFTSDAVALADFIQISSSESLLDLCTGVGVIPLLVWQRSPFLRAVGIELQKDLAKLAVRNVRQNHLSEKILILQQDIRSLTLHGLRNSQGVLLTQAFDVISANPPYRPVGRGRLNPNSQKAIARHEVQLTFVELLKACKQLLKPRGRFYFVHLSERESEILGCLDDHGFIVTRKEHPYPEARKRLLLIKAEVQ